MCVGNEEHVLYATFSISVVCNAKVEQEAVEAPGSPVVKTF